MKTRPMREMVCIEGELSSGEALTVEKKPNLADNPLVVGERYQMKDFAISLSNHPGWFSSGIVIGFIGNKNHKKAMEFKEGRHLKVYELKGRLGFATDNFREDGKIIEKSNYRHVRESNMMRVVAKLQAIQQTQMFRTVGVDLRSEEAYQLASKGLIRPAGGKTHPIIYSLKLTQFLPPDFTIEMQCINDFEYYLLQMIHEIGQQVKSSAMCTGMRLVRYGPFTVDDALLFKHWTVENIINNIKMCETKLKPHVINPSSANLVDATKIDHQESFLEMLKRQEKTIK